MKNPYKRGKVHPSPPSDQFLSLLPTAILALVASFSPDDCHVLAYLIFAPRRDKPAGAGHDRGGDHVPCFVATERKKGQKRRGKKSVVAAEGKRSVVAGEVCDKNKEVSGEVVVAPVG